MRCSGAIQNMVYVTCVYYVCAGRGWPLNFHFMFDLLAVLTVGVVLLSLLLPKSAERKRDSPEDTTEGAS